MQRSKRIPFKHQLEGSEYILDNGGGFLFMEQRTGKTLTALLALERMIGLNKILIVTKSTIMQTWKQEIGRQNPWEADVCIIAGTRKKREALLSESWLFYIVNYEMLHPYRVIDRWEWDVVIFDESSSVANEDSKVTRYALPAINSTAKDRKPGGNVPLGYAGPGEPGAICPSIHAGAWYLFRAQ